MFAVSIEPKRRLVRLELAGFWSVKEAHVFAAEQQAAVRRLGPPFGNHVTLADVREFAVQSQEVGAVIRDLVLNAASTSRRIALVGGTGLASLQFKRLTERDGVRRFDTVSEAEEWLCGTI